MNLLLANNNDSFVSELDEIPVSVLDEIPTTECVTGRKTKEKPAKLRETFDHDRKDRVFGRKTNKQKPAKLRRQKPAKLRDSHDFDCKGSCKKKKSRPPKKAGCAYQPISSSSVDFKPNFGLSTGRDLRRNRKFGNGRKAYLKKTKISPRRVKQGKLSSQRRFTKIDFDSNLGYPGEGPKLPVFSRDDMTPLSSSWLSLIDEQADYMVKTGMNFDSTLGYPGEGPPRRIRGGRTTRGSKRSRGVPRRVRMRQVGPAEAVLCELKERMDFKVNEIYPCRSWERHGTCVRGDACPYSHHLQLSRDLPYPQVGINVPVLPPIEGVINCDDPGGGGGGLIPSPPPVVPPLDEPSFPPPSPPPPPPAPTNAMLVASALNFVEFHLYEKFRVTDFSVEDRMTISKFAYRAARQVDLVSLVGDASALSVMLERMYYRVLERVSRERLGRSKVLSVGNNYSSPWKSVVISSLLLKPLEGDYQHRVDHILSTELALPWSKHRYTYSQRVFYWSLKLVRLVALPLIEHSLGRILVKRRVAFAPAAGIAFAAVEARSFKGFAFRAIGHSVSLLSRFGGVAHTVWNCLNHFIGNNDLLLDVFNSFQRLNPSLPFRDGVVMDKCLVCSILKPVAVVSGVPFFFDPHCHWNFGSRFCFGVNGYYSTPHRNCECNERISMRGRLYKRLPIHDNMAQVRVAVKPLHRMIHDLVTVVGGIIAPVPFLQWVRSFPPRRRGQLIQLSKTAYDVPNRMVAKAFIKREPTVRNVCTEVLRVESDPRWIQGCPLVLTLIAGPYVRAAAKRLHDVMHPRYSAWCSKVVYTCGLSNERIGAEFANAIEYVSERMDRDDRLVIIEDDQSRFDLHLGYHIFRCINHQQYRLFPSRVARVLQRGECLSGVSYSGTRYTIPCSMQSGWPDTSFVDTLVNAAMKLVIHGVDGLWRSIICGDDSVTVTTQRALDLCGGVDGIVRTYSSFGFEAVVFARYDPLDVEFCSGRFMPCRGSFVLMPKVGRLLARIGWDRVQRSEVEHERWQRSIADTLLSFGKYDPLMFAAGSAIFEMVGDGLRAVMDKRFVQYVDGSLLPSVDDVYEYYLHHYSLLPSQIRRCVTNVRNMMRNGGVIDSPLVIDMVAVDISE